MEPQNPGPPGGFIDPPGPFSNPKEWREFLASLEGLPDCVAVRAAREEVLRYIAAQKVAENPD